MSFFFEFPHTRTYDSDLGWLIKTMKELAVEYAALISWKEQHSTDYNELLRRVTVLENEVNGFINEINERFDYKCFCCWFYYNQLFFKNIHYYPPKCLYIFP